MNRYSYTTDSTYQEGNNSSRVGVNTMDEIITLIKQELPEGRQSLKDSFTNLERVAEYCEDSYYRSENKKAALEETKNFTTQSLASVAYQINTLASNYIQLLDLQANNLAEMESQMNHIAQTVMIHREKVARREIGVLTANKIAARQYKIVAPSNPEKPIKYVRKPIDYTLLDEVGHGIHLGQRQGKRASNQSVNMINMNAAVSASSASVPPPTTKPPTPPNMGGSVRSSTGPKIISNTGTLGKSSRGEYRAPPIVVPPQVPSHYAPNYPIGHPRRQTSQNSDRGPGYSSLPMPPSQQVAVHLNTNPPQMVQPMTQTMQNSLGITYDDRNSMNMPPPPSPLTTHEMPEPHHIGLHTLSRNMPRPGSQSPPLPPPPEEQHLADFGRPRTQQSNSIVAAIVPEDRNLPGWVPKNYIEKVVAIYDYYADKDDELSFQESSVIYVLKKNDDGWWEGVMDGVTGLFPGNYVESCV